MELPRYLWIDLENQTAHEYPIPRDYWEKYLGGKSLAARLLLDHMSPELGAFHPENLVIINTGPLVGTGAPCSSRFNVSGKNALTGGIASSNCGGNFGLKLRQAGFEGLIISGKAESPVHILLDNGKIHFQPAQELWGLETDTTQKKLPDGFGHLVIGPAGENGVLYSSIFSQERVAARCGLGAILGSKRLKAISARGDRKIRPAHPDKFRGLQKKWVKVLLENPMTGESLPRFGTMGFIAKAGVLNILPVKNFSQKHFSDYESISGEYYAEKFLEKNYGCPTCPIRCGRRQIIDGKDRKGPEYETVGLFGSNLLNSDLELISQWNTLADRLGLDTITLGATLGVAMELKEKGLADFGIGFGDFSGVETLIKDIAFMRGKGKELAQGSRWLEEKYGAEGIAPHSKGMEYAAYDPATTKSLGLGYATANRGACHLNGGYMVFLEGLGPLEVEGSTLKAKATFTVLMQNLMEAISITGNCLFTSLALLPPFIYRLDQSGSLIRFLNRLFARSAPLIAFFLNYPHFLRVNLSLVPYSLAVKYATGLKMNLGRLLEIGERSFNIERQYNMRAGINSKGDELSQRAIHRGNPLHRFLPYYYKIRGWDDNGIPLEKKKKKLEV